MAYKTREEWLMQGMILLADEVFKPMRHVIVPKLVKVSCGFPSTGAFAAKKQRIGECWYPQSKNGKEHQLFISPTQADPVRCLDILTHELVHVIAGKKAGHRNQFKRVAIEVGLQGPMRATFAGPDLEKQLKKFIRALGPYPHNSITKMVLGRKKQTARQLKATCPSCGYLIRITAKWIEEVGLPLCPACDKELEQE